MNKNEYDRYEFANAIIGWLGTTEVYLDLLKIDSSELDQLIQAEDEEFEEKISAKLSTLTVEELNVFSQNHNLDCLVI